MTKKHTLVAVAAIIAAKRSALEKRCFINLTIQSKSNLTFGQLFDQIIFRKYLRKNSVFVKFQVANL